MYLYLSNNYIILNDNNNNKYSMEFLDCYRTDHQAADRGIPVQVDVRNVSWLQAVSRQRQTPYFYLAVGTKCN